MEQACHVYEGVEQERRLEKLGITSAIITAAVEAGEAEARLCTDNDPPMARGLTRYFRTVRVLREGTAVLGWRRDNPRNLARAVSPDRENAIVPALGDARVGDPDVMPSTKYDKGNTIIEAVGANVQLALFDLPTPAEEADDPSIATWILLYHIAADEIRYELSLPVESTGGFISGWRERIIFAPIAREPEPDVTRVEEEYVPDIDVLIARR